MKPGTAVKLHLPLIIIIAAVLRIYSLGTTMPLFINEASIGYNTYSMWSKLSVTNTACSCLYLPKPLVTILSLPTDLSLFRSWPYST